MKDDSVASCFIDKACGRMFQTFRKELRLLMILLTTSRGQFRRTQHCRQTVEPALCREDILILMVVFAGLQASLLLKCVHDISISAVDLTISERLDSSSYPMGQV